MQLLTPGLSWNITRSMSRIIMTTALLEHTVAAPQRAVAVVYPDGEVFLSLRIYPAPERAVSIDELMSIVEDQRKRRIKNLLDSIPD